MSNINEYIYEPYKGIKNVNVIVGNNGSGKTTVLKKIISLLTLEDNLVPTLEFSCIFWCNVEKKIYYYINKNVNFEFNYEILNEISFIKITSMNDVIKYSSVIFLNNSFSKSDFFNHISQNVYDGSVGYQIKNVVKSSSNERIIDKYYEEEMRKQITLVYAAEVKQKVNFIAPFKLPGSLSIQMTPIIFENMPLGKKIYNSYEYNLQNIIELFSKNEFLINTNSSFKIQLYKNILSNLLSDLFDIMIDNKKFFINMYTLDDFYDDLEFYFDDNFLRTHLLNDFQEVTKIFVMHFNDSSDILLDKIKLYEGSIKYIFDFIEKHSYTINDKNSITISLKNYSENEVSLFLSNYNKTAFSHYLKFDWNLSTGESNFLNLYSIIYDAYLNIHENTSNFIYLIIDEADFSFHPEWQANYIKSLLQFVSSLFNDFPIQIILATHSPILLSDFPKHNVLYLKNDAIENSTKENKFDTFGQNIYDLFSNSFFLNTVSGTHAENTFKRIDNDIIKLQKKYNNHSLDLSNSTIEDLNTLFLVSSIIGEDLIRSSFQKRIETILGSQNKFSNKLKNTLENFSELNKNDKKKFIDILINMSESSENND